jgi:hypothetical protein
VIQPVPSFLQILEVLVDKKYWFHSHSPHAFHTFHLPIVREAINILVVELGWQKGLDLFKNLYYNNNLIEENQKIPNSDTLPTLFRKLIVIRVVRNINPVITNKRRKICLKKQEMSFYVVGV